MSITMERSCVAAAFESREMAEEVIGELVEIGVDIDRVGVAMRSHQDQDTLIEHTGAHKAAEPIADMVTGGILGGVAGAILSFGVLSVPGVGPVIAGGVLASMLAGAGIGAATGGIRPAFSELGFTGTQADLLEARFTAGDAIIVVDLGDSDAGQRDAAERLNTADAGVVELATPTTPVEK